MTTLDDFVTLVRDEIGLDITAGDVTADLDEVEGWDSVHLLALMMALERATGRTLDLEAVLHARSLEHIYTAATS